MKIYSPKNIRLELIRGIASLLVFITHVVLLNPQHKQYSELNIIANWGTESVIIFFILSGIVINMSQTNKTKPPGDFLFNRFIRLFPQFSIGVLLALLMVHLYLPTPISFRDGVLNLAMLSTLQGYIVPSLATNTPLWSLTFEMSFYILFSILLLIRSQVVMFIWCCIALISIGLYLYFGPVNLPGHIIAVLSFSSIWLTGYFIYELRNKIFCTSRMAFLSLGLLPLISRLQFSEQYYDPFKYLIFALVSIPFFSYCISGPRKVAKFAELAYMILVFIMSVGAILLFSTSRLGAKSFYIVLPLIFLLLRQILNKARSAAFLVVKSKVKSFAIVSGKYSYSIYIIHYPLLFWIGHWTDNLLIYVALSLTMTFLFSYFLENYYQKNVNRIAESSKRGFVQFFQSAAN
jgi:peptidoglycan/LPS O-acetylase OafA/YrhL